MNMKIVASLLLFGAYAGVCSDIVWSGDVVVPESADVTCTDHGYVTSISLGANSVVRFNTRTAHSFPITGSGKIIKEGDAEWTMTTAIPNFAGDYEIASGVVNVSLGKVFGADDVKHKLVVRKGATLSITAKEGAIIKRHVHIAGDGAPGRFGALEAPAVSTTEHFLDYLYLDGDATLYTPMSGLFFVQGELDLSGFKLTVTGAG